MTKIRSKSHKKSSKIVLKSRSRGGLARSWGLFLLQIAQSKSNKKQSKAKENKGKQSMTKSPSKFHKKSSKIVLKSRSRGGLGGSWGLFLLQISLSRASWGALGSIWHQKPKKGEKHDLFGCFWAVLGGVLAPMWAPRGHLGCILGVLGSMTESARWL